MSDITTATPAATPAKSADKYGRARPKVPPFARYRGTSAFRIDRRRAREYARFKKAQKLSASQG